MGSGRPNGRVDDEAKEEPTKQAKPRSKPYPRYTLQRAEEFAQAVFDEGPWRVDQDRVAKRLRYSGSGNGAYKSLLASVGYFGLIKVEGNGSVSVSDEWRDVFHQDGPDNRRQALQAAMHRPQLYQLLIEEKDHQLPTEQKLRQHLYLNPKFGIVKDAAELAARTFVESAQFAGMIDEKGFLHDGHLTENTGYEETVVDTKAPLNDDESPIDRSKSTEPHTVSAVANLDVLTPSTHVRQEVPLPKGQVAYLIVPHHLSSKSKERLKMYIDLLLDEEEAGQLDDEGETAPGT